MGVTACPDCGCEMEVGAVRSFRALDAVGWYPAELEGKGVWARLLTDPVNLGTAVSGYRCPLCKKIILDGKR